ncbi:chromosome partitioning ATPase [Pseudoduganella albidiflava]|uniref:non-specific protein-tyrosine kinase n=2 Tax=Pseudoduganella albidiflava TaxID=321983 RepID=A0AA87XSI2_9BURK|nr:chromosome partitioning ATPase [Pseudoduganella albidiflava]
MSIIEKAANRIGKSAEPAAPLAQVRNQPIAQSVAQPAASVPEPVMDSQDVAVAELPEVEARAQGPAVALSNPEPAAPEPLRRSGRMIELDLARMNDAGLVTAAGGRTNLVEDFRIIKRPLIKRAFVARKPNANPGNLIMITSSLPGEGKTFTSINLAMSIAMELDHTVLLVDADVARPSVLRTLGLPAQRGLMDILLDEHLDMSEVMLRTNVNTLSILPAGTSNPRATELLASQAMKSLVLEIASRYPDRIVIFDSPPLLLTSEAHVLASHMGQIVVVVESEKTTQHAVKEALQQLEGCSNVNLVYNKSRELNTSSKYDYHYG